MLDNPYVCKAEASGYPPLIQLPVAVRCHGPIAGCRGDAGGPCGAGGCGAGSRVVTATRRETASAATRARVSIDGVPPPLAGSLGCDGDPQPLPRPGGGHIALMGNGLRSLWGALTWLRDGGRRILSPFEAWGTPGGHVSLGTGGSCGALGASSPPHQLPHGEGAQRGNIHVFICFPNHSRSSRCPTNAFTASNPPRIPAQG